MYPQISDNKVKLYGEIYEGDARYILAELQPLLDAQGDVHIHVHSPGGNVMEGNLLINAIKSAKANVIFHVDGLAASMMAIMVLSGNRTVMADNALLMIHPPNAKIEGNAKRLEQVAKMMRSVENGFIKAIANKTKKTEAELRELMVDDNWFDATEALAAGLIDEIEGATIDVAGIEAYQDLQLVAQLFAEYDTREQGNPPPKEQPNKTNKEMLKAQSLLALGLSADAKAPEVEAAVEKLLKEKSELESNLAEERKAKVIALVAGAIASGKILASEKDAYEKDATENFDLTARFLEKLPAKTNLAATAQDDGLGKTISATGRENWTLDDWRKKDPAGFLQLKASNPEQYKQIWVNK